LFWDQIDLQFENHAKDLLQLPDWLELPQLLEGRFVLSVPIWYHQGEKLESKQ
jgi:hypothetical protein